jgi:type IV secretion system protein VirD4
VDDSALNALRQRLQQVGHRLYLGAGTDGMSFAQPEQAVLVVGPPRSGKTSALVIPNVLAAPGAVVVTSTKADVLAATVASRRQVGNCWLFDPTASVPEPDGVTRIRWSPVAGSRDWDDALLLARAMVSAARPGASGGEASHWSERAESMMAPLLHAAALSGADMSQVVDWVSRHELSAARAILSGEEATLACAILVGLEATDGRELSGIFSTAAGVLSSYRSERVLASSAEPNFRPEEVASGTDTVYICAPAMRQALVAPLTVGFIEQIKAGAYDAASRGELAVPVTFALDELANIAPLPDLPSLIAEGGSQGVLTLACLQDLAQARARWGPVAEGFMSLFGTKVILGGIGDLRTLEVVSQLAGYVDVPVRSRSRGPWWSRGGAPSVSVSTRRQRRLEPNAVAQQPRDSALVLEGPNPPVRLRLTPWYDTPPFSSAPRVDRIIGSPANAERSVPTSELPNGRQRHL